MGRGRHAQEHSDGVDHLRRRQRAHRAVAGRMQRHAGLLQLLPGPQEQDQRNLRRRFPEALRCRLSQHHRARDGDLSGVPAVGGGGQEGRQHRPHEGHRGAGNRNQHRCALGQGHDRSSDPPLRPRRSHCRSEGQETQRARRLRAAEAVGYGCGVRPHQESNRQPAIRHQDLKAGWPATLFGNSERGSHCSAGDPGPLRDRQPGADQRRAGDYFRHDAGHQSRTWGISDARGLCAIVATSHGISIWIAMLVVAPIVVGIIGVIVELTIIRFLYGRMVDTMLATWGLSLFLVGLTTSIFGNTTVGISAPLGSFQIGAYRTSGYTLFVIAVAAVVMAGIFGVLRWTRLGLIARGTMQNANMAAALGVNPPRVYAVTFGIGAALSGLAGAVLAPVSGVFPTIGVAYVAKSFITVIGGGAAILSGTVSASALFGTINQIATFATTPVFGEVALLATAIVLIRLLPQGITGRFFRRGL